MEIKIKNESLFNIRRDIGVYAIRCIPNGNLYIGSTKQSFRARFSSHCKFLLQGKLSNKKLQTDFNKYGKNKFEFEILGVYPENLTVLYETKFIENLKPVYNISKPCNNSKTNLGKKFTEEHKNKLREKSKLFKHKNIDLIVKQNKEGANRFEVENLLTEEITVCNSKIELGDFIGLKCPEFYYNKCYKHFKITVLKLQKKTVSLLIQGEWVTFTSYEKCDKFLNKWRGFTSTQSLKKVKKLEDCIVKWGN